MDKIRYIMKPNVKSLIADNITQKDLAKKVGISTAYMNEIITHNKRRSGVNERLAYFICKAINPELEIADVFEKIEN